MRRTIDVIMAYLKSCWDRLLLFSSINYSFHFCRSDSLKNWVLGALSFYPPLSLTLSLYFSFRVLVSTPARPWNFELQKIFIEFYTPIHPSKLERASHSRTQAASDGYNVYLPPLARFIYTNRTGRPNRTPHRRTGELAHTDMKIEN